MIRRYNTSQIVSGLLRIALGAVAFWLAFVFFRFAAEFGLRRFFKPGTYSPTQIAAVCTGLVAIGGWWQWRKGEGHKQFTESDLFELHIPTYSSSDLRGTLAGQAPAMAYVLSQIFLAGPLQVLKGISRLRSLLPVTGDLEERMTQLLQRVRSVDGWHDARKYVEHGEELSALVKCGAVEFSAAKMRVKAAPVK